MLQLRIQRIDAEGTCINLLIAYVLTSGKRLTDDRF